MVRRFMAMLAQEASVRGRLHGHADCRPADEIDNEAELSYWTVERSEEDQDDDDSKYEWIGYVATSYFLGKPIVYGLPAEYTH